MAEDNELTELRRRLQTINRKLLSLLGERGEIVLEVKKYKEAHGIPAFVPEREMEMLDQLVRENEGPYCDKTIQHLFKEIFAASVKLIEQETGSNLRIARPKGEGSAKSFLLGDIEVFAAPIVMAGPCAVESEAQIWKTAKMLSERGIRFLRGGAFKPRTSPYSFQGLGEIGLRYLREAADEFGLLVVTEATGLKALESVLCYADIVQIGARNMYNYELLQEAGQAGKPVFLKRSFAATIDEFVMAAEYVAKAGNDKILLCERGIRTFETQTRNTLDLSAVPLLQSLVKLPVIVDVSHAAGRKDILAALAKAAIASGANGLMVEVHPEPSIARSDANQQLSFEEFARFLDSLKLA